MMETIRIRRAGYPIRHTFAEFVERYRMLCPGITEAMRSPSADIKQLCKRILNTRLEGHDWQIGKTKVFLKDADDMLLEDIREEEVGRRVVVIQKWVRMYLQRKRYRRMKQAAVLIQKNVRRYLVRRNYLKVCAQLSSY